MAGISVDDDPPSDDSFSPPLVWPAWSGVNKKKVFQSPPQYNSMKDEYDRVTHLDAKFERIYQAPPFALSLSSIDDSGFYRWPIKERKLFVPLAGQPISYEDFGNLSTFFHATTEKQQEYAYTIRQVNRIIHDYYTANSAHIESVKQIAELLFQPGVIFFLTKDKGVMRAVQFLGEATFQQVLLDRPLHPLYSVAHHVFYVGGVAINHFAYTFATDERYESAFSFLQSMYELLSELWINDGIPFCTSLNFLLDLKGECIDFEITNGLFTVKTTTPEYQGRIPPYSHIQKRLSAKGIANLPLNPITEFDPRNIEFALIIGGFFSPRATEKVGGKTRDLLSGQQSSTNRISYQFDLHRSWPLGTDVYQTWTEWDLAMSFSDFWRLRPFRFWSEQILKAFRCCLIRVRECLKKWTKKKNSHINLQDAMRLIFRNGALVVYYHNKRQLHRGSDAFSKEKHDLIFQRLSYREKTKIDEIMTGLSTAEFKDMICVYDVIAKINRFECVPFFVTLNYLLIAPTISGTPTKDDFLRKFTEVDGYNLPDFDRRRQHNEAGSYDYFEEDLFQRNRFDNYPKITVPIWPGRQTFRDYDSGNEGHGDPGGPVRLHRRNVLSVRLKDKQNRIEKLNPLRQLDYKYHLPTDSSSDVEKRKSEASETQRRHKPNPSGIRYGLHDQPSSSSSTQESTLKARRPPPPPSSSNSSYGLHHQPSSSSSTHESTWEARHPPPPPSSSNSSYGLHHQPSSSSSTHESTWDARHPPPPPPPSFEDQDEFFEEGQIRRKKKKIIVPRASQIKEEWRRDVDAARKKYFRDDDDDDDDDDE